MDQCAASNERKKKSKATGISDGPFPVLRLRDGSRCATSSRATHAAAIIFSHPVTIELRLLDIHLIEMNGQTANSRSVNGTG